MWVYRQTEPGLFTVGFYAPDGAWHTDSDWNHRDAAAERVSFLNGGRPVMVDTHWKPASVGGGVNFPDGVPS